MRIQQHLSFGSGDPSTLYISDRVDNSFESERACENNMFLEYVHSYAQLAGSLRSSGYSARNMAISLSPKG